MKNEVNEAIKIYNGKPIYVIEMIQGENGNGKPTKVQVYIKDGNIYFEDNRYGFENYAVFNFTEEAHVLAKEMFMASLKAHVHNKLLEIKQLEVILDSLGLKSIVSEQINAGAKRLSLKERISGTIGSVD